jgi:hypothetical protein
MPCNPLKVNRSFGEIYRLHLQGKKAEQDVRIKADDKPIHDFTLDLARLILP